MFRFVLFRFEEHIHLLLEWVGGCLGYFLTENSVAQAAELATPPVCVSSLMEG